MATVNGASFAYISNSRQDETHRAQHVPWSSLPTLLPLQLTSYTSMDSSSKQGLILEDLQKIITLMDFLAHQMSYSLAVGRGEDLKTFSSSALKNGNFQKYCFDHLKQNTIKK